MLPSKCVSFVSLEIPSVSLQQFLPSKNLTYITKGARSSVVYTLCVGDLFFSAYKQKLCQCLISCSKIHVSIFTEFFCISEHFLRLTSVPSAICVNGHMCMCLCLVVTLGDTHIIL